jgi:DNA-binding winged helix-turn-helix (wHTH) protein/TolB-like protein
VICEGVVLTASSKQEGRIYEFGPFRLEAAERLLLRYGQLVQLPPKVFDTLVALVEQAGHLVTKDDLMSRLWPDTFVEEGTLTRNISDLRKVLEEAATGERYIETVPRHGYRFLAPVKHLSEEPATFIIEKHTRSRIVTQQEETLATRADGGARQPSLTGEATRQARWLFGRRAPVGLTLLFALAAALFYFGVLRTSGTRTPASVRSIAVLPFNYIGEEGDRYIEIGIADALITRLSRIRSIAVRPTSAVTKYNRPEKEAIAAGRELRVESVLEGRIHRSGERVRVSIQLISVEDGSTLWADHFDSEWRDMFAAQDSISERIIRMLSLELTGEEKKRLAKRHTESAEAYQAYMKGRYWWNKRTDEGYRRAIDYFNQAIGSDPNYALAYSGLADCYALLRLAPTEIYPKAKAAAMKALEIDDQLAEAHTSLARILFSYDWDWSGAETEYRRAIELDPNYPTAHQWYSVYLSCLERHQEAIAEAKRALELDPVSLTMNWSLAWAYYRSRQYDKVIEHCLELLELEPNYYQRMNNFLAIAYEQKGLYDQFIALRLEASPYGDESAEALKGAYVELGWKGYWQKELDLAKSAQQRPSLRDLIVRIYMRLGQKDKAMELLEELYDERSFAMVELKVEPLFDDLRTNSRFQDLLRKVGLAP